MMRTRIVASMLCAAALAGCGDSAWPSEMDIPDELVTVPLSISGRASKPGERVPTVTLTAEGGGVRVHVATQMRCDMQGTAGYKRRGASTTEIMFVATVWPNPAALCTAVLAGVNEYEAVVPGLAPATYTLFVYEAGGNGKARFIGGGVVQLR
jgi:hypothetical protein